MKESKYPYRALGERLKKMRAARRESLAEVSGAVEIEVDMLSHIEQGAKRPSEDILLLLISYFEVKEDEALGLWELAGYSKRTITESEDDDALKTQILVMPIDARIVYTDMAHVTVNDYGVVVSFLQTAGPSNKPLAVSRIGMSKEHARSVIELLQNALYTSEPKALPAPKEIKADQESKNKSENK